MCRHAATDRYEISRACRRSSTPLPQPRPIRFRSGAGTVTLAGKDEMDVVLADAYTSYNTLESVSHLYQLLYTVLPASCRQQILAFRIPHKASARSASAR